MTAQINDRFIYKDKEYAISALEHPHMFFDISKFGITPEPESTACWRGYVATFTIGSDNRLLLTNLLTNNGNGKSNIISISGIQPHITKPEGLVNGYKRWRNLEYTQINLPIDYSGGMMITAGFIRERYVHMGFQSPWSYNEVIELVFSDGICSGTNDLAKVAQTRRTQDEPLTRPDCFDNVPKWICDAFDLGYEHRR